ncbi:MAG: FecR domain-containing protein [Mangrovibacterium sp.]|nr:FecR domain-containing protein [Mangrovibacterium sp.]
MEDIWTSISRQIAGEANESDREKVSDWLKEDHKNQLIYKRLERIWGSGPVVPDSLPFLYWRVKRRIQQADRKARSRRLFFQISRIAAVILLLLSLSFFAWHYFTDRNMEELPVAYHTIVVPKGNRSQVILPDSTKVWLNNDTKIVFPERFRSATREVELTGEAFFEVKHDQNRPFLVKAGESRIRVLGTTFAVTAYADDPFIETSLIEGKVIFEAGRSSYELTPGSRIRYDRNRNALSTQQIGSAFYDYWKNGVYSFKNESLESLAKKVYRIYNIRIVFKSDFLKSKTYTGTLSISDNIFTFMEAIKRTSVQPIDYQYDYTKNIIYLNQKSL